MTAHDLAPEGRISRILRLSIPIMAGMMSQNLLNIADVAMVGRLGPAALAAVGMGGVASFLSASLLLGLSPAVQAMAARREGAGQHHETAVPLTGGVFLALLVGTALSVVLYRLTPTLFPFLHSDPDVVALGIPYLRMRIISIAAVGINFSFRGFWNGVNRPKVYMSTLASMSALNIGLNYVLIFGKLGMPAMGATGAGLASAIATFAGALMYIPLGWKFARQHGFLTRLPGVSEFTTLIRLAFASGIQHMFYAGGATALFWIVGKIGTIPLAAANIIIQLSLVGVLPCLGLGMTATSMVGQALGRGDQDDAVRWAWDVSKVALAAAVIIGLPMIIAPQLLLRCFTPDLNVIATGAGAARLAGFGLIAESIGLVMMHALLGAGANAAVTATTILLQWAFLIPTAYIVGPVLGGNMTAVWVVRFAYRCLFSVAFVWLWRRGKWKGIEV